MGDSVDIGLGHHDQPLMDEHGRYLDFVDFVNYVHEYRELLQAESAKYSYFTKDEIQYNRDLFNEFDKDGGFLF